ncbi:MAG: hypothetical protein KF690_01860 [Bacteroidetes bacterium]|nr:hypothetical protein [Bacteroidota bacterium]
MHNWFLHLFEWTAWANACMGEAISPVYSADTYVQRQFSHIIHAQERWLLRLRQEELTRQDLFEPLPLEEALQRDQSFAQAITALLTLHQEDTGWLRTPVPHTTNQGQQYILPVQGVLTQLLHHGTHHRAQLAARLTSLGYASPPIDYIFYARQ